MSIRPHAVVGIAAALVVVAGCQSPEATRMRSGGSGADVGNRGAFVQMHEGSRPYWSTPERLAKNVGMRNLGPAQQAARAGGGGPAAAPR